ncbi:MAG: hypothetical protein RIE08_02940 [Acidimicrobiales bacterium]
MTGRHRPARPILALLAVIATVSVLAAGCGGGDDDTSAAGDDTADATDGDTATGDSTTTTTTPPVAGGDDTADDGASTDGDGSTGDGDDGTDDASGSTDDGDDAGDDDGTDPGPTTTTTYELADEAFTEDSAVSTVGLDEIIFGMTPDEAAVAAATTWDGLPDPPFPPCVPVTPSQGPDGVTFYVIRNTIERVDITNPDIRTRSGYGVGTTLDELESGLGSALETVSDGEDGVTATFVPTDETDADFRIVFEVELGEVVSFRSGRDLYIDFAPDECATLDPPALPREEQEEQEDSE